MCGFQYSDQWWLHQSNPVLDNSDYKLLYDFNLFTDHRILAWRPDLVLMDEHLKCTTLIDVACVMDRYVVEKHREKVEKYLDLAVELQTHWNMQIEIVPLVFGTLGSIPEQTMKISNSSS